MKKIGVGRKKKPPVDIFKRVQLTLHPEELAELDLLAGEFKLARSRMIGLMIQIMHTFRTGEDSEVAGMMRRVIKNATKT